MPEHPTDEPPTDLTAGSPCLQGERVSFTGTLASMPHRQAHELVEEHGGTSTEHVSRQTTLLVVGEEGWPLEQDGQPSQKLQQVTEWKLQGIGIRVLTESEWLHLLGLQERRQEVHRLYTPAMLSQLLDVPVGMIRGWERQGLIQAVRKVYRLPYFDFQEVTGTRRIIDLLEAGVSRRDLEASLKKLRDVLPGVDRPLAQLEVLVRDARLVYRDESGLIQPHSGQRLLDFEPSSDSEDDDDFEQLNIGNDNDEDEALHNTDVRVHWSADDWLREGRRLLEAGDPKSAVEAFRLSLMDDPGDEETSFYLAEALYRSGNSDGAIERYYSAVERDPNYLEAWTQLGCLLAERGNSSAALEAFDIALNVHADYPDAHWQKASVLCELGRDDEALEHWKTYLRFDSQGPWADQARQRLQEAGVLATANVSDT